MSIVRIDRSSDGDRGSRRRMMSPTTAGIERLDVELSEEMTWRQGHEMEMGGIPGGQDDPSIIGMISQPIENMLQLIDALAGIIRLSIEVGGAEMTPLEAIDRTEITLDSIVEADGVQIGARTVTVPDLDALVG